MHIFLQSNACADRYPGNHSSHFKIHLPETLHFPKHEVCLERVYYNKEFSSIDSVPIEVTIEGGRSPKDLCRYKISSTVSSGEEFVTRFLEGVRYDDDSNRQLVCFQRGPEANILVLANRTSHRVSVEVFPSLIQAYNLNVLLTSGIEPLPGFFGLPGKSQIQIKALLTGPVTANVSGRVRIRNTSQENVMFKVSLPKGYFKTGKLFVEAVNDVIWTKALLEHPMTPERESGPFSFNPVTNRCEYEPVLENVSINMGPAAYALGFREALLRNAPLTAVDPVDFTAGIQTINIFSDIVDSVIVGDVKVPLLAAVPFNRKMFGEREYYEFVNPPYLPVVQHPFNTIELQLCDDVGNPLKRVLFGKTLVCLHVRERL